MLMSIEHEMPAINLNIRKGVMQSVFVDLWKRLSTEGWLLENPFSLVRKVSNPHPGAQKACQMISTDTGPTVEIAPSPRETIDEVNRQLSEIRTIVGSKLQVMDVGLLGSGIHPYLGNSLEEYYEHRTPRPVYEYAVDVRQTQHRMILNIAAIQEVIDVPVKIAPLVLSVMHRLGGVFLFLCRNDPDLRGSCNRLLSVRPKAWREQFASTGYFAGDQLKIGLPPQEVNTWQAYLHLLWDANPMFILGSKSGGFEYVPEHPTFGTFISLPMGQEWTGRRLSTKEDVSITPHMSHVEQTDWNYMGFARLRLFWKGGTSINEVVKSYHGDELALDEFMSSRLEKVLLENRISACSPPGEEMCSLALIVGLIENFDAVKQFADARSYEFWLDFARQAEGLPLSAGNEDHILSDVVSLSRAGLLKRGIGEEMYLEPIVRRLKDEKSPSERMLDLYDNGGIEAVVENLLYQF